MFYCRASYEGQRTRDDKRMHGRGCYTCADGSVYVGTFHDGVFHGHAVIFFPPAAGGGQFRGTWDMGVCTGGRHIFGDGLVFSEEEWAYATDRDRRLWGEYLAFISPATRPPGPSGVPPTVPDYTTTDGIPEAFANGKPRGPQDVSRAFWASIPLPHPERERVEPINGDAESMAEIIAETREVAAAPSS